MVLALRKRIGVKSGMKQRVAAPPKYKYNDDEWRLIVAEATISFLLDQILVSNDWLEEMQINFVMMNNRGKNTNYYENTSYKLLEFTEPDETKQRSTKQIEIQFSLN